MHDLNLGSNILTASTKTAIMLLHEWHNFRMSVIDSFLFTQVYYATPPHSLQICLDVVTPADDLLHRGKEGLMP